MAQPPLTDESQNVTDRGADDAGDAVLASRNAVGIDDPALASPRHRPISGDWHDDDGLALDDFFEANPQSPNLVDAEAPIKLQGTWDDVQPAVTRIISRAWPIGVVRGADGTATTTYDPIQILPADPHRKHVEIKVVPQGDTVITGTSPAAGTGYSLTLPFDCYIDEISFRLLADANVANRVVSLRIQDSAGAALSGGVATVSQTATVNWQYHFSPAASNAVLSASPANVSWQSGQLYKRGTVIQLNISAVQVGDQMSDIRFLIRANFWRIAGEKSEVYAAGNNPPDNVWRSRDHTGPIWIYAPDAGDTFNINAISVTT